MAVTVRPLLDELRHAAVEEAAAARAAARAEADRVRGAARDAAAARRAAAIATETQATDMAMAVTRAEATRAANERLLPARAAALDRIFARAAQRIEARARHPAVGPALDALMRSAAGYLPDGAVTVRCAAAARDVVARSAAAAIGARARIVVEAGVPLGAVLESGDGGVSVDATFAHRMVRERAALAAAVASRLGEPAP